MPSRLKIAATSTTRSMVLAKLFALVETTIVLMRKIIVDEAFEIK